MLKYMMITGYRENIPSKYGETTVLHGLLYKNISEKYVGRQLYTFWVNGNNPLKDVIKRDNVGKDLYIEFGANGRIEKVEVK